MGKKARKNQSVHTEISPAQTLIGYSGKVLLKKLKPLRRSRSDKVREKTLEQDYLAKCSALACRLQDHRNLLELMVQMVCCNGKDKCVSTVCQELKEKHDGSIKLIKFHFEEVGATLDVLPQQTKASLCEMMDRDEKLRVKLDKVFKIVQGQKSKGPKSSHLNSPAVFKAANSHSGEELFQIFVHGIKHDRPLVLILRQDELGQALRNTVLEKCPSLPRSFIFLHQGRKICLIKSLKEQGLTHDSNIHVHFGLRGGMDSAKDPALENNREMDPRKWKKAKVIQWIDDVCEEYEIDGSDVLKLKTISGAGLTKLTRQDWIERSPNQGDFFFNLWTELIAAFEENVNGTTSSADDGTKSSETGAGTTINQESESDDTLRETAKRKSKRSASPCDDPSASNSSCGNSQNRSELQGLFGTVESLDKIRDHLYIDELLRKTPPDGEVITLKGLCFSTPRNRGAAGTVYLRNESKVDDAFVELDVEIKVSPESKVLNRHKISTILDVKLSDPLVVRGRIQRPDKEIVSMTEGVQRLPFKVVVDSDEHAAVRNEATVSPAYSRPKSETFLTAHGIFSAEGTNQETIFLNDTLRKIRGNLYCLPEQPLEKMKESMVALKNSSTGDIFVGVSPDRRAVGAKVSRAMVIKKREDMARALGEILPNVNESVDICATAAEADECVERRKDFVAAMWLQNKSLLPHEVEEEEEIPILFRIHVVKGTSQISFIKKEHTRAYTRVGAETKLMADYEDLFNRLESLASRNIPEKTPTYLKKEIEKGSKYVIDSDERRVFDKVRFETDKKEFKEVFGVDPKKIILEDHIKRYSASFLNTDGGDIYFGIQEDTKTKIGYVVGVFMSEQDRKELVKECSEIICNFWPSVDSSHFFMKFTKVKFDSSKNIVRYPESHEERARKFFAVSFHKAHDVPKFIKHAKSKVDQLLTVLRLKNNRCCILVKDATQLNVENFISEMESESGKSKYFQVAVASPEEVEDARDSFCVVHLHVSASQYPIHLTGPLLTFNLDPGGEVAEMKPTKLLECFKKTDYSIESDKLLNALNRFEKESTSYVLVCSPFSLQRQDRDLYGIVVPEWALVLDFDQTPNQDGHLLNIFKPLHDRHQVERNLFVRTPRDRRLQLDPSNGVCWCAVRGYEDVNKTLAEEGHASWMKSHGRHMRTLIEQLILHVSPNQLVVVCLWDDGHEELLPSLYALLEDLLSSWGPTKIIFVCSNPLAKSVVLSGVVDPLERARFEVKRDNVIVALPHEMARHVGAALPPPYRSEDAFQVPRRFYYHDVEKTIPDTLPQPIRQAIQGHIQLMYLNNATPFQSKSEDEDKVRVKFFSGSEIDEIGLVCGIAIEREKMKEVKKELRSFLTDKRSHVCFTILKAERGAGATTLCMQLLFEFHKQYVCARLLEFNDSLGTNIEKITQFSRLPLILFVDSEMTVLPEFNDFKNEAERRNLNLKLLVVESYPLYSQQKKKQSIPYFVGTAPFKTMELSRELTQGEVAQLVDQFLKLKDISEEKKVQLKVLKERVARECSLRKFAFFSLTVFGKKFSGLKSYVQYRLAHANELQLQILEFLALIHVYTDFLFPVNAFASMAKTNVVLLEKIFSNDDVRELLSPPSSDGRNLRRISFVEVAEELLRQQSEKRELSLTLYLKDVALRLARCALSDPRSSKKIERITRQLYITSEYGSEKFSPLVRFMRESDQDAARDMLLELSETFENGTSVWAHLLAHLAKYYMIVYEDFQSAIPRIEEAVKAHKEDPLLHHIHGDIIRLQVQNLKDQKKFSLDEVVRNSIRSSSCFEIVKDKRPLMEHGYSSDALVRKIVMLAAMKSVGRSHFVDYLKVFLEEKIVNHSFSTLSEEDKYILALVPDSFANLRAVPINEHTAKLKDNLLENLGSLEEMKVFCESLKEVTKGSSDEDWVDAVVLQTLSLIYSLEIERRQLQPEEADERIRNLEDLMMTNPYHDEESMKIWIRCVRLGSKVPPLKAVRRKIDAWLKFTGRRSPFALFYNYVVAILEAVSDPDDKEKMNKATKYVEEFLHKRSRRLKEVSRDPFLPVEWLHPKVGRHINSLDSLLYHEDLVREYLKRSSRQGQKRGGKEIIERALFEEQITKWKGIVSEKISDWRGTITFKNRISVSFVPINVQPYMPNEGDEVQFCLAFHWTGPFAWHVACPPGMAKAQKAAARVSQSLPIYKEDKDSTEKDFSEDDEEHDFLPLVGTPLHREPVRLRQKSSEVDDWTRHLDEEMQGIVVLVKPDKGYGRIFHPKYEERLFFHAKQFVPPVDDLDDIKLYSVVSFTVGKAEKGPRAMNVMMVEEDLIDPLLKENRIRLHEEEKAVNPATPAVYREATRTATLPKSLEDLYRMKSRLEGYVCSLEGPPRFNQVRGFIEVPSTRERVFFHEFKSGISKEDIPHLRRGTKVQFSVEKGSKGFFAQNMYIQHPESEQASRGSSWDLFPSRGIQEGYIAKLESTYGFITKYHPSETWLEPSRIFFHESDLRGYQFNRLVVGDRVHFSLGKNEKGYFAQKIDVQSQPPVVIVNTQGGYGTTSSCGPGFLPRSHLMPSIGQFSQLQYAGSPNSPNAMGGHPLQEPGSIGAGRQHVSERMAGGPFQEPGVRTDAADWHIESWRRKRR
ncbi:uncharacterized protein LOC111347295 isoform X2 [Stylophora pistillata]|uniref:PNT domain-containing protein n=1 Tax=Stylophora pistillata TaxID=50429 RepID=A0A2B4SUE9_STYPI|nr:uncharacterized protein LOC111347295 isoform X2 [Stylophora pistillata]PFX32713.1 hypothetical protein AWC38_SpisGene2362 [Stylophora pistillata]